ncbi:unnamed protein product [Effrenium voratum]|nr:unnamed protein product [Effrenium voratum]
MAAPAEPAEPAERSWRQKRSLGGWDADTGGQRPAEPIEKRPKSPEMRKEPPASPRPRSRSRQNARNWRRRSRSRRERPRSPRERPGERPRSPRERPRSPRERPPQRPRSPRQSPRRNRGRPASAPEPLKPPSLAPPLAPPPLAPPLAPPLMDATAEMAAMVQAQLATEQELAEAEAAKAAPVLDEEQERKARAILRQMQTMLQEMEDLQEVWMRKEKLKEVQRAASDVSVVRYEIYGFQHGELDGIYELRELFVGEHPTWWQLGSAHFMYFCAPKAKWHICPVASPEGDMLEIARKGGDRAFAYNSDDQNIWMEYSSNIWIPTDLHIGCDFGDGKFQPDKDEMPAGIRDRLKRSTGQRLPGE